MTSCWFASAYGTEYAYGAHDYPNSGVFEVEPKQCPGFRFRKTIIVGTIWIDEETFRKFMEAMACEYTGESYNLMYKNCNHFCNDVCLHLIGSTIPNWVNRLAKLGMVSILDSPFSCIRFNPQIFYYASSYLACSPTTGLLVCWVRKSFLKFKYYIIVYKNLPSQVMNLCLSRKLAFLMNLESITQSTSLLNQLVAQCHMHHGSSDELE
jgi:hypothetical protein